MFLQVSEYQGFIRLSQWKHIARKRAITIYQKNFNDFKVSLCDTYELHIFEII